MPTRIQYVHKEAAAIIQGTPTQEDWMTLATAFHYDKLLAKEEDPNMPVMGLARCLNNFGIFAGLRQQLHLQRAHTYFDECDEARNVEELFAAEPNTLPNLKTLDIERYAPFYPEIKAHYEKVHENNRIANYEAMLTDMAQVYLRQQTQQKGLAR